MKSKNTRGFGRFTLLATFALATFALAAFTGCDGEEGAEQAPSEEVVATEAEAHEGLATDDMSLAALSGDGGEASTGDCSIKGPYERPDGTYAFHQLCCDAYGCKTVGTFICAKPVYNRDCTNEDDVVVPG